MKAIVSDTAPQRSSPASRSDLPGVGRRRKETDGSALGELAEVVTPCKLTGEDGGPAQTPGDTGQIWSVTFVRGGRRSPERERVRAKCAQKRPPNRNL